VPKPLVPIGGQPIVSHLMNYYSGYGHRDFVLCLGYKANAFKAYFDKRQAIGSAKRARTAAVSESCPEEEGRITLVDTALWRNIGQRLLAVREHVQDEAIFMANYSDGLTDVDLDEVLERFKQSNKVACFLAVRPPLTYHVADIAGDGNVQSMKPARQSEIWINGGYFIFKQEIFDYIQEGEELVVEPFQRLIEAGQLMAFKHEGFWQSMDTLKERKLLEDMIARGQAPWLRHISEEVAQPSLAAAR
jgi:glucose-1-phosphate cytidylyltransferase